MDFTPLHEAAAQGHAEVVEVIVKRAGGSSKLEEMLSMRIPGTSMELAVVNNHLKVARRCEAEATLPKKDDTQSAFDQASTRGCWELVEFILAHIPCSSSSSIFWGCHTFAPGNSSKTHRLCLS